jgi:hypothetical protein
MNRLTPTLFRGATTVLFSALFLVVAAGCDSKDSDNPVDSQEFSGIQMTFEDGRMGAAIGDVSDDWRSLAGVGLVSSAAYPNPTSTSTSFTFRLDQPGHISIWLNSAPGTLARVVVDGDFEAGDHTAMIDVHDLTPGIYRLFASIVRDGVTHTTYGDIQVE